MKTSLYTILCIVIRLGAVIIGVELLEGIPALFAAIHRDTGLLMGGTLTWLYCGLLFLIAFLLWLYPGMLARLAVGRSSNQIFESPISAREMMHAAFAVLGAYFVLQGLTMAAYEGIRLTFLAELMGGSAGLGSARAEIWVRIGGYVISVMLGAALMLGGKGLAELLQRIRYGNQSWEES